MNLHKTLSISIVVTSLLLCGNAFAKPDNDAPPIEVDVFVVNDSSDPVPVIAPKPESWQRDTHLSGTNTQATFNASNPGMTLKIEHVSIGILINPGALVNCIISIAENELVIMTHRLVTLFQGAYPGGDIYRLSQPITLYAPELSQVVVTCLTSGGDANGMQVGVSGHWY